jgi:hypothetical protein
MSVAREVLIELLECARAWVPSARLVGTVGAGDVVAALEQMLDREVIGWAVRQDDGTRVSIFGLPVAGRDAAWEIAKYMRKKGFGCRVMRVTRKRRKKK